MNGRHPAVWMIWFGLGACAGGAKDGADSADGGNGGGSGGDGAVEDDGDGDGYGAADDCDDADADVFPGAVERCNGIDDDCDGSPHAEEADSDGDGLADCTTCDAGGFWQLTVEHADDDAALWTALESAVATVDCEYGRSRSQIFTSFDLDGTAVECVYTGTRVEIRGGAPDESEMNVEHTWPRSEGAEVEPANCDVHHLFPTVSNANSERASHPFGDVTGSTSWSQGGSALGSGSGGTVFEPRDSHKGNVARAMLYVRLRYRNTLAGSEASAFGAWNALDPVDETDHQRNVDIERYQGNQNPFVACPDLAAKYL